MALTKIQQPLLPQEVIFATNWVLTTGVNLTGLDTFALSGNNPVKFTFTPSVPTSAFALTGIPISTNPSNYRVDIDGVLQEPGTDYYLSGSNIIFTVPVSSDEKVVVVANRILGSYELPIEYTITPVVYKFTTLTTTSAFTLTGSNLSTNAGNYRVDINGVLQEPNTDYYLSGSNIIFTTPISAGEKVVVVGNQPVGTFDPSFSPVIATGTTTPRTLQNRFADVINVKDFGAKGDDATDDTQAIQAAINSVSPFGTVFIPEGVYRITSTLIVPNFPSTTISGVNFIGEGDGSVFKLTTPTTLLSCNGDTVSFEKLGFDGQAVTPNAGIIFEGANNNQNVTVKDCYFAGWNNAIVLYTDAWTIHNNRFVNCTTSINCANWAMNGSCANNYTLGGLTSITFDKDKTRTSAFILTGGQQAEGVRVYDNCFLNTGDLARPIVIRAGLEISIFNNIIDQVGLSGIGIFAAPIPDPDTTYSISHIKVRDNWINCGRTNRGVCMQVASADTMWIEGNTFNTPDGQGLALTLNTVNTYWITNNTFLGTGTIGFSGTPFITVNSVRGNIYGNMNRFGALSAFETNNFANSFVVNNVPTLSSGLPSGSIWSDAAAGNVLKIVP